MKRFLMTALIAIFLLMVSSTFGEKTPSTSGPAHDTPEKPGDFTTVEEGLPSPTEVPELSSGDLTLKDISTNDVRTSNSKEVMLTTLSDDCAEAKIALIESMFEDIGLDDDCKIYYEKECYDLSEFEDVCTCDGDGTQTCEFCVQMWYVRPRALEYLSVCCSWAYKELIQPCPEEED